jgi:hypothetical protein
MSRNEGALTLLGRSFRPLLADQSGTFQLAFRPLWRKQPVFRDVLQI